MFDASQATPGFVPVTERSAPSADSAVHTPVAEATVPPVDDGDVPAFDEAAESAFLAEARARGEAVPPGPAEAVDDEKEGQPLPALHELVQRIPAEVRATLDDLFRARFTGVRRVRAKDLKSP